MQRLTIPISKIYELPPLMFKKNQEICVPDIDRVRRLVISRESIGELSSDAFEQKVENLAGFYIDQYFQLIKDWLLGKTIWEWSGECLRQIQYWSEVSQHLHYPDLPPCAERSVFADLLGRKGFLSKAQIEKAVALRLIFQTKPSFLSLSFDYLSLLCTRLCHASYQTWSEMRQSGELPPDNFTIQCIIV